MIKIGVCQIDNNSSDVHTHVMNQIDKLDKDVDMIILPECFNAPYGMDYFTKYAEDKDETSKTYQLLQHLAVKYNAYVVGGTFITKDTKDRYYNTCYVFNRDGEEIGVYDKIHLFDIELPGNTYKESSVLTAGSTPLVVKTEFGNIGIGVCFDLRFPKLAEYYKKHDCKLLCYPGAFTMKTGKDHYELLLRSLALNNQCYVVGCAPARNESASYVTWSNSTIVNPWGTVVANLGHEVKVKSVSLDITSVDTVRKCIPIKDEFVY